MKILAFLITGLIFTAMPISGDINIELNREFELGVNDSGTLNSECLKIVFDSVSEDSRCPEGVNCIWSGNAVVKLIVSKNGKDETELELNTNIEPSSSSYKGLDISLKRLSPYPKEGVSIRNENYRAALLIGNETADSQIVYSLIDKTSE